MYKVLIVDDEPWILRGLRGFFAQEGDKYTLVGEGQNGAEALALAEQEHPDIIISDIRMPDLNGLDFVEQMQQKGLQAKIILLSGYADFEYARKGIQLGVSNYLLKPLDRKELREALEELAAQIETERNAADTGESIGGMDAGEDENWAGSSEIGQIMEDIEQNFTKDISLNDLAQKYALSLSHLSGLIKQETGMTFTDHVASRRIKLAEKLLGNPRYTVADVGRMVGYDDYYYFTKWFKRLMGVTPSKYRRNKKEEHQ